MSQEEKLLEVDDRIKESEAKVKIMRENRPVSKESEWTPHKSEIENWKYFDKFFDLLPALVMLAGIVFILVYMFVIEPYLKEAF